MKLKEFSLESINSIDFFLEHLIYPRLMSNSFFRKLLYPVIKILIKSPFKYIFKCIESKDSVQIVRKESIRSQIEEIIRKYHSQTYGEKGDNLTFFFVKGMRKKIFFLFLDNNKYPSYIWKIAQGEEVNERLLNEYRAIQKIISLGDPLSNSISQVVHKGFIEDDIFILETILKGTNLKRTIYDNRNNMNRIELLIGDVRDWLVLLHRRSSVFASIESRLDLENNRDDPYYLKQCVNKYALGEQKEILSLLEKGIDKVKNLPTTFVIYHSDFTPENVLYNESTKKICVIDWEYSAIEGLPLVDLLYFLLSSMVILLRNNKSNKGGVGYLFLKRKLSEYSIDKDTFEYIFFKRNLISQIVHTNIKVYCDTL